MKNSTIIEAALLLCGCHLLVSRPTYLGGFILGVLVVIFHQRALKTDKKDQ